MAKKTRRLHKEDMGREIRISVTTGLSILEGQGGRWLPL